MGLISVRLGDEDERFLRKHRLSISDVVRQAVHARVTQLRALEALDSLEAVRWRSDEPVEETLRRMRDAPALRD